VCRVDGTTKKCFYYEFCPGNLRNFLIIHRNFLAFIYAELEKALPLNDLKEFAS